MVELVTGGSGSGKSAYAEERICGMYRELCGTKQEGSCSLYYIATMFPYGAETEKKIERHRRQREGKGFQTLEWYTDIKGRIREKERDMENACVLLECMSNLAANELYMDEGIAKRAAREDTAEQITAGVRALAESCRHLVIVTNEVFSGPCPDSQEMETYKLILGEINRSLARSADAVTEVVYGIPCPVKERAVSYAIPCPGKINRDDHGRRSDRAVEKDRTEHRKKAAITLVTGGAYQGKAQYVREIYSTGRWLDGDKCPLEAVSEEQPPESCRTEGGGQPPERCRTEDGKQPPADCQVIGNFHCLVRRWLKAGRTKEELLDAILRRREDIIIVCDEIGCGLVPADAFEREYRETVGRICTDLAGYAGRVDRVICGIGQRIK